MTITVSVPYVTEIISNIYLHHVLPASFCFITFTS